eukprot:COSAG01_NODE_63167_length_281_cov_0.593407_1_plen_35_part_01
MGGGRQQHLHVSSAARTPTHRTHSGKVVTTLITTL